MEIILPVAEVGVYTADLQEEPVEQVEAVREVQEALMELQQAQILVEAGAALAVATPVTGKAQPQVPAAPVSLS